MRCGGATTFRWMKRLRSRRATSLERRSAPTRRSGSCRFCPSRSLSTQVPENLARVADHPELLGSTADDLEHLLDTFGVQAKAADHELFGLEVRIRADGNVGE